MTQYVCVCVCVCVEVTGLLSQGRGEGNEWVTAFLVSYSLDAYHWSYVTDQYGNQRVNSFIHSFGVSCQSSGIDGSHSFLLSSILQHSDEFQRFYTSAGQPRNVRR